MQEIWDLILYNFIGFLVVVARTMGIFTFNPIFGRQTVPMRVRVSMSLVLALVMTAFIESLPGESGIIGYVPESTPGFVLTILLEAALGYLFGLIVNMVLSAIILAGKIIDNQMTISLAEIMDPSTGVTMPIMANLYYYLFILYFFVTNAHLNYIRMFALSYEIIPVGFRFTEQWRFAAHDLVMFFGEILAMGLKMAMPIVAAEMVLQICVGVIMKAVPSIQIFVINIQMKILMGLFVTLALAGPMSDFVQSLMDFMFEHLFSFMESLGV